VKIAEVRHAKIKNTLIIHYSWLGIFCKDFLADITVE